MKFHWNSVYSEAGLVQGFIDLYSKWVIVRQGHGENC